MSKRFWFQIRLIGWIIILIWYVIYTVDAINPILNNQLVAISHGITGIAGTALVLIGYYNLIKKRLKREN
jgi:uncharacterized membrane-anchored protein